MSSVKHTHVLHAGKEGVADRAASLDFNDGRLRTRAVLQTVLYRATRLPPSVWTARARLEFQATGLGPGDGELGFGRFVRLIQLGREGPGDANGRARVQPTARSAAAQRAGGKTVSFAYEETVEETSLLQLLL